MSVLYGFPSVSSDETLFGIRKEGLPEYSREDVSKHRTPKDRIWITYKEGVYDITDYVDHHPGGRDKIMLSAGISADPFWNLYKVHQKPSIMEMLECMRVGNLKKGEKAFDYKDPYSTDPERHPMLKVISPKPFNAEAPREIMIENEITPNELFFVRNHLPVPHIDQQNYKLEIVLDDICTQFTLQELIEKFESAKVKATLQCSGNRRSEMEGALGLQWGFGAISTAEWTGVRLSDLLKYLEIHDASHYKHVIFEGHDKDPGGHYETSIPIELALDPIKDVILAYKMNGEDLPLDHGFPLRIVVPGVTGARSVKWLKRITLSTKESESLWTKRDYKVFGESTTMSSADWTKAQPIYETPVNAAIVEPPNGSEFYPENGEVQVKGFAYSGGGKGILRVEVTTDRGQNWTEAELTHEPESYNRNWSWVFWRADVPVSDKETEVCVRAMDTSHNIMPSYVWNFRGLLNNAWHCIKLHPSKD